jgi:WS/DGAT/MGAT family acyltransferase
MVSPYEGYRGLRASVVRPRRMAEEMNRVTRGMQSFQGLARRNTVTSLNGPIGPHRRWAWARGQLADVKAIRQAHGGTVNDVVLAVITRGFRDLLVARGEQVDGRVVRTMVPVSVRAESERGTYNNKVSAMFADLPVGIADAGERLRSVREQMEGLKQSGQAVAAERLSALSDFAPPMLLALGGRAAARTPQRNVQTVTTNVPGPRHPLHLGGRRMIECFPFVPLGGSVRIGIAIMSYDGALNFGVTGDYEHAPDIALVTDGIEAGIQELLGSRAPASVR